METFRGHPVEGNCTWCKHPIKIVGVINLSNDPVYVHTNEGRNPDEPERCVDSGEPHDFATHPNQLLGMV